MKAIHRPNPSFVLSQFSLIFDAGIPLRLLARTPVSLKAKINIIWRIRK
jgi:hypothetical protein